MKALEQIDFDLIVSGGGLAGCMAAVEAAKRGLKVAIVERRAYLGREIAAYDHCFVPVEENDDVFKKLPGPFDELFRFRTPEGAIAPEGYTRQLLMRTVEKFAIPVLFESEAVGLFKKEGRTAGLLLACPVQGLALLQAPYVIDAGERHSLIRSLSGLPHIEKGKCVSTLAFEMEFPAGTRLPKADGIASALRECEEEFSLIQGSLKAHPTISLETLAFEFAVERTNSGTPFFARSEAEAAARDLIPELVTKLRAGSGELSKGKLSFIAHECRVSQKSGRPTFEIPGLLTAPELGAEFSVAEITEAAEAIAELIAKIKPLKGKVEAPKTGECLGRGWKIPLADLNPKPAEDDALKFKLFKCEWNAKLTENASISSEICVAGLGAGGGLAAQAAAEHGRSVIGVDFNRELGGTHSAGRVCGYYGGYRGGANERASKEAVALMAGTAETPITGGFNFGASLLRKATKLGIRLLGGSRVCGARVENGELKSVLVANEDGLLEIAAQVSVDASGDADLAAFAGAAYEMGDPRDGMVQTYSMWGAELYPAPSFLSQRYLYDPDLFHPDVLSERLRAIAMGHRENSPFHISPMLTPRESRRIVGEHRLNCAEILDGKSFPDVVAVAMTQADSHAHTSSPLARAGAFGLGREIPVRIPYGSFVPRGIERLLVAAKALSGERDATSFCRMNADIKNAGYAIGTAAAMAVENGGKVRGIDIAKLQKELKKIGILPDWAFRTEKLEKSDAIDRLGDKSLDVFAELLRMKAETARPKLEREFEKLEKKGGTKFDGYLSRKSLLAMALAWHGSKCGEKHLASLLKRAVAEKRHLTKPHLKAFRTNLDWGGLGIDDYSLVNRLLAVAARSGGKAVLEPLAKLIAETPGPGERVVPVMPYDAGRKDIVHEPFHWRLMNVAFAADALAAPELADAMETLLKKEGVGGYDVQLGSPASPRYMRAYLEFQVARAAARCGSKRGVGILRRYAKDVHVFLRRAAAKELAALK